LGRAGQPVDQLGQGPAERSQRRHRAKGVGDVELAQKRQVRVCLAPRCAQPEVRSARVNAHIDRAHLRLGPHRKADRAVGADLRPRGIVAVERGRCPGLAQPEQTQFRVPIGFEGAVVVEVIVAEVGEDDGVEAHGRHPVLVQGVGRDLHAHATHAVVAQAGEPSGDFDGPRGGQALAAGLGSTVGPHHAQRADRGRGAAPTKEVAQQRRGRCFAVRTGDADHGQRRPGIAIEGCGGEGRGTPAPVHRDLGHVHVGHGALHQGGHGASANRLR
jgi:hypothetical protein